MSEYKCDNFVENFISTCQDLTDSNLTDQDVSYLKKYLSNVNKRWKDLRILIRDLSI